MSQDPAFPPPQPPVQTRTILPQSLLRRFSFDLFRLPRSHKLILTAALLLVAYGFGHQTYPAMAGATTEPSRGMNLPLWARHLGSSMLLGYVVGWAFRTFIKTMALITGVIVVGLFLLSFFNITNIDLTAVRHKSSTGEAWLDNQAKRLRDDAMSHVHSTFGSIVGLALGARKRTIQIL